MSDWTPGTALDFLLKHGTSACHRHDWEYLRRSEYWQNGGFCGYDGWWVTRCRLCGVVHSIIEADHECPERLRPLSEAERAMYPKGRNLSQEAEDYIRSLDPEEARDE